MLLENSPAKVGILTSLLNISNLFLFYFKKLGPKVYQTTKNLYKKYNAKLVKFRFLKFFNFDWKYRVQFLTFFKFYRTA